MIILFLMNEKDIILLYVLCTAYTHVRQEGERTI